MSKIAAPYNGKFDSGLKGKYNYLILGDNKCAKNVAALIKTLFPHATGTILPHVVCLHCDLNIDKFDLMIRNYLNQNNIIGNALLIVEAEDYHSFLL